MTMEPLPEGGIETTESAAKTPQRTHVEDPPAVSYTVKELLARIESKLDVYARRQETLENAIQPIQANAQEMGNRLFSLEANQANGLTRLATIEAAVAPVQKGHQDLIDRVYQLELSSLAKKAVSDFRSNVWRLAAGTSGMTAIAALVVAIFHH